MVKQITKTIMLILASFLLLSCGVGQKAELQVEVWVSLDGKAASQAKILLDGVESGTTDGNGYFSARIYKQPGTEVRVAVQKEAAGYEIEPWEGSLVVKLPKEGAVENYPFKIALKATKFVTLFVAENGEPLEGASIRIRNKKQGKTDHGGEYVLSYKVVPKRGLDLKVSKKGYNVWRKRVKVTPGQIVDVSLSRKQRIATLPKVQKAKPVAAPKKTPVAEAKPVARLSADRQRIPVWTLRSSSSPDVAARSST